MAKRTITDNPSQGLFNTEQEKKSVVSQKTSLEKDATIAKKAVSEIVIVPQQKETRSRKKLFLFEPSLYSAIENKCSAMGISMNEAANQLFKAWTNEQ